LGFAGILTARYKDLARTYWGIPRAKDIIPSGGDGDHSLQSRSSR
jgi:hypothetical protein